MLTNGHSMDEASGSRFPKLEDCAHFHYESTEGLGPISVSVVDQENDSSNKRPYLVDQEQESYR